MRRWFGQSLTDWSMVLGDETEIGGVKYRPVSAAGPVAVTFWDAPLGGTQYDDLLDASGSAITQVMTADGTSGLPVGTVPRFQGPEGVAEMWADAGGGVRYLMTGASIGGDVAALLARVAELENAVDGLQALTDVAVLAVTYDEVAAAWPVRPAVAGARRVFWLGPNGSPPPAGYMATNDEFHGWAA